MRDEFARIRIQVCIHSGHCRLSVHQGGRAWFQGSRNVLGVDCDVRRFGKDLPLLRGCQPVLGRIIVRLALEELRVCLLGLFKISCFGCGVAELA